MRLYTFARRNAKEILRDKLTVIFGIGFPVVIMLLLSLIKHNVPPEAKLEQFEITNLAPGVTVFGLSFIALFSGMVISKDRSSSLMLRLYASPLTALDFILGYTLPLIPIAMLQLLIVYIVALPLGLPFSGSIFAAILCSLPTILVFIAIGLLCGTVMNEKQVGGLCGALLTNLAAWLSGIWFEIELLGSVFVKIAFCLPFARAVRIARSVFSGQTETLCVDLLVVSAWAIGLTAVAVATFMKKMKK